MFHSYFGITRRYSLDFYGPVATPRVMDQSMIAMSAPHSAHSAPDRLLDVFGAPHGIYIHVYMYIYIYMCVCVYCVCVCIVCVYVYMCYGT